MITCILNKYGLELIRKKKNPSLKSHLFNLLNKYPVDLVIDVGANHGQFGHLLRSIGFQGEILSFEPTKKSFEMLSKAAMRDKRWKVYQLGLGSKKKIEKINIFESSDFNSILQRSISGKEFFKSKLKKLQIEEISIDTLDSFLAKHQLNNKKVFLKMDTQGYDLEVFKGASKFYSNISFLLTEISFQSIYKNMPDYHKTIKFYESKGFSVSGLYPVSRTKDGSIIEMDCFMINKKIAVK